MMFDSLQNGLIMLEGSKISFLNELSNKVLSQLTGVKDFAKATRRLQLDR